MVSRPDTRADDEVSVTRRSFGTRTMTGLNAWLYRHFVKSRSSANDLRDVEAGMPLRVYCYTRTLAAGLQGSRSAGGYLHVEAGKPVTWRALIGAEELVVTVPQDMATTEPLMRLSRLTTLVVETSDGTRRIAIPKADVDLLAWALDGKPVSS